VHTIQAVDLPWLFCYDIQHKRPELELLARGIEVPGDSRNRGSRLFNCKLVWWDKEEGSFGTNGLNTDRSLDIVVGAIFERNKCLYCMLHCNALMRYFKTPLNQGKHAAYNVAVVIWLLTC
jgi:hypothetical protein